ncbi:MAG: DNA repair protein RecO [Proteobacteria bacterium]|nr:DNA repair protein RecO [Pseudomonadota bacterium]
MEFTEKALVLKVGRFRESDIWLRLFFAGRGVVTAFAFGGSRSTRRFCGCLDQLVLGTFRVGSNRRGTYKVLEEGTLLHAFPGLRSDPRKLGLVAHCLKFVEAVQIGSQGARPVFDLLLETLGVLEMSEVGAELLPLLFKAKLTFEQGLKPDLTLCVRCGRPAWEHVCSDHEPQVTATSGAGLGFSVERGGLVCVNCCDVEAEPLSIGAVRTLEWISSSRPADWPRLALEPEMRRQLGRVVDRFVAFHLGLRWEHGMYRKI